MWAKIRHKIANKEDKTIRRCKQWQVAVQGGGGKHIQLSVKGLSVQADGNTWKGCAKHITSLLYSLKHVRSPDWPGNHRLHTADKKREMPRNKITLSFHLLIIMFVFHFFFNLDKISIKTLFVDILEFLITFFEKKAF